jgi:hypothetical protein
MLVRVQPSKPEISTGHHFKFTGAAPNAAILPPKEPIMNEEQSKSIQESVVAYMDHATPGEKAIVSMLVLVLDQLNNIEAQAKRSADIAQEEQKYRKDRDGFAWVRTQVTA